MIKAKATASVAKSTSTSSAVGFSLQQQVEGGHRYSVTVYAHGVGINGKLIFDQYDDQNNYMGRYTEQQTSVATLPMSYYSQSTGIHFGAPIIIG